LVRRRMKGASWARQPFNGGGMVGMQRGFE